MKKKEKNNNIENGSTLALKTIKEMIWFYDETDMLRVVLCSWTYTLKYDHNKSNLMDINKYIKIKEKVRIKLIT